MILDAPPKGWKRPAIPVWIKLYAMLRELDRRRVSLPLSVLCLKSDSQRLARIFAIFGKHHFHHMPGLWERRFAGNDTIPPANDPNFIFALTEAEHDVVENGPGGEKRITSAGSASNRRAKIRRANKPKKRRGPPIRSRGFDRTKTMTMSGKVIPRKRRRQ